jgi:hypothetical protein
MIGFLKRLKRSQRGNVLVLTAAAMPLLIGSAGLATDTIQWALWKRDLQRAADSAAIAGVYERIQTGSTETVDEAVTNDLSTTSNITLDLLEDPVIDFPADDSTADLVDQVEVTLSVQKPLTFSSMFMAQAPIIKAKGTAASVPGTDDYCVMALETNAAMTGVTVGGNAKVEMDCGIISNSPSPNDCLVNQGNASSVTATVMACVGGLRFSRNWTVPKYDPYTEAIEDPYGDLNVDRAAMNCMQVGTRKPLLGTSTSSNFNGANATITLGTARTMSPGVNCFRGLTVGSNQSMHLPNGTYYIGEAGLDVQGTLTCDSCTVVLTTTTSTAAVGTMRVTGGGLLGLKAPTGDSDPYRGIAIFQDRAATDNTNANRINGNSATYVEGAIYFPKQEITYNGGGTAAMVCTRLVARRLIMTGNAGQAYAQQIANEADCDMFEDDPIGGGRRVRLVA